MRVLVCSPRLSGGSPRAKRGGGGQSRARRYLPPPTSALRASATSPAYAGEAVGNKQ